MGVVSAEKTFDAFGNVVSESGVWKHQFGYAGKFGYQSDPDTGLKLLGHRYYDPDTGRFLTRDPIKDGRNWYSYCENNPVNRVDPSGLTWYYDQATGNLWWDDPSTEQFDVEFIDNGFSGKKGDGRDDPSMELKKGKGPIPKGRYKMGFGEHVRCR